MKVLIMNANGPNDGEGTAERRKKCISDTMAKQHAELILFQEFTWSGITGKTWEKTPISTEYIYKGNKEASVLYDSTMLSLTYPTSSELLRLLDEMIRKGELPIGFAPLSRMCICIVERREIPKIKFVCVSWHGRYKGKEETLVEELKYLLIYLQKLCSKKGLPLLLAGDFNLQIEVVKKLVSLPLRLYEYTPLHRRAENVIDYYIASTPLKLDHVTPVDLRLMTKASKPYDILDHDPVCAFLLLPERQKAIPATSSSHTAVTKRRQQSAFARTKTAQAPRSQ